MGATAAIVGISALSAGTQLYGASVAAKGQRAAGQAANAADQYNAAVAEQQAQIAATAGDLADVQIVRKGALLAGAQEAAYSKAGVKFEGTPSEVMADAAGQIELERMTNKFNVQVEQNRLRSAAALQRFYGASAIAAGNTAASATMIGGVSNAVSTLLTGASMINPGSGGQKIVPYSAPPSAPAPASAGVNASTIRWTY